MEPSNNPSVMIADDSEDTRDLLRYWLEAKRCRVVEATNGQEAVAGLEENVAEVQRDGLQFGQQALAVFFGEGGEQPVRGRPVSFCG